MKARWLPVGTSPYRGESCYICIARIHQDPAALVVSSALCAKIQKNPPKRSPLTKNAVGNRFWGHRRSTLRPKTARTFKSFKIAVVSFDWEKSKSVFLRLVDLLYAKKRFPIEKLFPTDIDEFVGEFGKILKTLSRRWNSWRIQLGSCCIQLEYGKSSNGLTRLQSAIMAEINIDELALHAKRRTALGQ